MLSFCRQRAWARVEGQRGQPGLQKDNEVIAGQSDWRAESQLTLEVLKDPGNSRVPRSCFWIERTIELASRLEASTYLFLDFSLYCSQRWPVFGRVSPRRQAAASGKQFSVPTGLFPHLSILKGRSSPLS